MVAVPPSHGIVAYPFPFAEEGRDIGSSFRSVVPFSEILTLREDRRSNWTICRMERRSMPRLRTERIGRGIPMVPLHGQFADREHRSLLSEDDATLSR